VEFGDTVYALATVTTISVLLFVPMDMVFGLDLWIAGRLIAVLIAAFITGLIFAGKLAKQRIVSIAKIMVLAAVLIMFVQLGVMIAGNGLAAFKDMYLEANPGTTWTNLEWANLMDMFVFQQIFFYIVLMNAVGFVGIYIGSMVRKTATS